MADINFTRDGSTNLSPAPASTQQYVINKAGLQALAAATYTYAVGPTDAQGAALRHVSADRGGHHSHPRAGQLLRGAPRADHCLLILPDTIAARSNHELYRHLP